MSFTRSIKKKKLIVLRGDFPEAHSSAYSFIQQLICKAWLLNIVLLPFSLPQFSFLFLSCLSYSIPFPVTEISLRKTLKITIGPFVPAVGFGESVGWWVSITTLPITLTSGDGQSDEARQVCQVTGPEETKARSFGFQYIGKVLCTSHWLSFQNWLDIFFLLLIFTSIPSSFSSHHTLTICLSFHFLCSAHP